MPMSKRFNSKLTALVLAGGLGSRLQPVLPDVPKVLAPVAGVPWILHILDYLEHNAITDVVLCTGHRAEAVEQVVGTRARFSREPVPLDTAGAARLALPLANSDPVIVLNGDSLVDIDIKDFAAFHSAVGSSATLALVRVPDRGRYGTVEVAADGQITFFAEKSDSAEGWISAGVYLLSSAMLGGLAEGRLSFEREVFPGLVGHGLYGYRSPARSFVDIGTPESYGMAERVISG